MGDLGLWFRGVRQWCERFVLEFIEEADLKHDMTLVGLVLFVLLCPLCMYCCCRLCCRRCTLCCGSREVDELSEKMECMLPEDFVCSDNISPKSSPKAKSLVLCVAKCDASAQVDFEKEYSAASTQTTATIAEQLHDGLVKMGEPVCLHIYDVGAKMETKQWVNGILRNVGTGAFHAGVEVLGQEWSFGFRDDEGTGVSWNEPKKHSQHTYRESVYMGTTPLQPSEIEALLKQLTKEWPAREYDVLTRNCCHFSDFLCRVLAVGSVPQWVLNLAGAGATLRNGAEAVVAKASQLDETYGITSTVDDVISGLNAELELDMGTVEGRARGIVERAIARFQSNLPRFQSDALRSQSSAANLSRSDAYGPKFAARQPQLDVETGLSASPPLSM
eukprot:TRINITY_DN81686_c0_g1_i1.p1 TRINITY_DN81686_c0_g1~~TRINITY_DN81686_c0_g1_i1.p1  ORF type:complete len:389 (-),score=75.56 TRINITY_DN81686_c0_g1_i1:97-1263(-)